MAVSTLEGGYISEEKAWHIKVHSKHQFLFLTCMWPAWPPTPFVSPKPFAYHRPQSHSWHCAQGITRGFHKSRLDVLRRVLSSPSKVKGYFQVPNTSIWKENSIFLFLPVTLITVFLLFFPCSLEILNKCQKEFLESINNVILLKLLGMNHFLHYQKLKRIIFSISFFNKYIMQGASGVAIICG